MNHKINLVFEQLSLQKFTISSIIRKCIQELFAQKGSAQGVKSMFWLQMIKAYRPLTVKAGRSTGRRMC